MQTDRPKKKDRRQLCQRSCITSHLRSVWHIRNSSTSWCRRRCRRLRKQIPGGIFLCLLRFSYIIVKEKHQQQHRKPKIVSAKWNEFWRVLSLKPKKKTSHIGKIHPTELAKGMHLIHVFFLCWWGFFRVCEKFNWKQQFKRWSQMNSKFTKSVPSAGWLFHSQSIHSSNISYGKTRKSWLSSQPASQSVSHPGCYPSI